MFLCNECLKAEGLNTSRSRSTKDTTCERCFSDVVCQQVDVPLFTPVTLNKGDVGQLTFSVIDENGKTTIENVKCHNISSKADLETILNPPEIIHLPSDATVECPKCQSKRFSEINRQENVFTCICGYLFKVIPEDTYTESMIREAYKRYPDGPVTYSSDITGKISEQLIPPYNSGLRAILSASMYSQIPLWWQKKFAPHYRRVTDLKISHKQYSFKKLIGLAQELLLKGSVLPIVIDKSNNVLDGELRAQVLKLIYSNHQAPVIVVEDENERE